MKGENMNAINVENRLELVIDKTMKVVEEDYFNLVKKLESLRTNVGDIYLREYEKEDNKKKVVSLMGNLDRELKRVRRVYLDILKNLERYRKDLKHSKSKAHSKLLRGEIKEYIDTAYTVLDILGRK